METIGRIEQGTIDDVVRAIVDSFRPDRIVLFGSAASGRTRPGSDLDLLVIMETALPRHKRAVPIRLLFKPAPCPMDILVYTPDEVKRWNGTTNHIITEALAQGKTIYEKP